MQGRGWNFRRGRLTLLQVATMSISLTPETQRLLEERLGKGDYRTADDIVHAALEALDERECNELDERTLDALDRAEDQIERGEVHEWADVRESIRAKFLSRA
jgi:putative addiction module CopG family antidote